MPHTINAKVREWNSVLGNPVDYVDLLEFISFLDRQLYSQYMPAKAGSHPEFRYRLRNWLLSAPEERDQKTLLELVPLIAFIGEKEWQSLVITAFNRHYLPWLIDCANIDLHDKNAQKSILAEIRKTWFIGLTDSAPLRTFLKVNGIEGQVWRTDFHSLRHSQTTTATLRQSLKKFGYERVVVLEDFVGSGTQLAQNVQIALFLGVPTLFLPLVICPQGLGQAEQISNAWPHFQVRAILALTNKDFVFEVAQAGEPSIHHQVRDLAIRLHALVAGTDWTQNHGPFGFGETGAKMGGLIVLHSDCPDNSLPLIHHSSDKAWSALFPRVGRIA